MFTRKRIALISALSSVSLAGSFGLAALPAHAATSFSGGGPIQCNGDLCAQTLSVNTDPSACSAVVQVTANNYFTGHFELRNTDKLVTLNSPTHGWSPGDKYQFTIAFATQDHYKATAWSPDGNGGWTDLDDVTFTINNPSSCP